MCNLLDIKQPDNDADCVISLTISGNALVRVTNFIDATLHNECKDEMQYDWYRALKCVNRQIQEQLSTQRMEQREIAEGKALIRSICPDATFWDDKQ